MWTLSRIALYPIKSLDPVFVEEAEILPGGALLWDRQFALFDAADRVINAKKYSRIHQIRADYDLSRNSVTLSAPDLGSAPQTFDLLENRPQLEGWFSDFFQQPVTVQENQSTGYPDDLEASGPTIISTQTFEELHRWFPEISIEELRLRFRANLEFTGDDPFCEDRLYRATDPPLLFQVGDLVLEGSNPCKRCVVPSRVPTTGETDAMFMKTFIRQREATFPAWGAMSLFKNMYRLAVNTRLHGLPEAKPARIHVGDAVLILP